MSLFNEAAHSAAIWLSDKAIEHFQPGQIPVIIINQPLYSIVRQIQGTWPDTFGENKFGVVMGSLYIEMNVMKLLGDILTPQFWCSLK